MNSRGSVPASLLVPSLAAGLLCACIVVVDEQGHWHGVGSRETLQGSGVRAEVERPVGAFHAIELEVGSRVHVRVGEPASLRLAGDDNLLAEVRTEIEDGVLEIDLARSCRFRSGLELVITTPALERFGIEGSGDVRIEGLAAERLALTIEGSGSLRAQGRTRALAASIEGSGDFLLAELESEAAELSIEGSGSMEVHVARALEYSIEGSGSIRYAGAPSVTGRIEGSGRVEPSPRR